MKKLLSLAVAIVFIMSSIVVAFAEGTVQPKPTATTCMTFKDLEKFRTDNKKLTLDFTFDSLSIPALKGDATKAGKMVLCNDLDYSGVGNNRVVVALDNHNLTIVDVNTKQFIVIYIDKCYYKDLNKGDTKKVISEKTDILTELVTLNNIRLEIHDWKTSVYVAPKPLDYLYPGAGRCILKYTEIKAKSEAIVKDPSPKKEDPVKDKNDKETKKDTSRKKDNKDNCDEDTKVSESPSASPSPTAVAKSDDTNLPKTGQTDTVSWPLIAGIIAVLAGAGLLVFKKTNLFSRR